MQSLDIAATGMEAQQTKVEVISNNIANMSTSAFKRRRVAFQDLLYQDLRQAGAKTSQESMVPVGSSVGTGVKVASIYRINEQGNITKTDNVLDLAINGKGYFQIYMPDGSYSYTRAGNFSRSAQGNIVTQDGYQIHPNITIPSDTTNLSISETGEVQVMRLGRIETIGQINLHTFVNSGGLKAIGKNLYVPTPASGEEQTHTPGLSGSVGYLQQGYLESSNVKPIQEITQLILAQRAYEMNSKVIGISSQMMAKVQQQ